MKFAARNLDPDLLEVLEDLGQHGRRALFSTAPGTLIRGIADGSALLRVSGLDKSKALDHLLEAHREELAYALFHAAVRGEGALRFGPWRLHGEGAAQADDRMPALPLGDLIDRAPDQLRQELSGLPGQAAASRAHDAQNVLEMLGACVRLVGRESARLHWALALAFVRQPLARRRALEQLLDSTRSRSTAAYAHHGLGVLHWMQGDLIGAREALLRAFDKNVALRSAAALAVAVGWCVDDQETLSGLPRGVEEALATDCQVIARVASDVSRIAHASGTTSILEENIARRAYEAPALATRMCEAKQ